MFDFSIVSEKNRSDTKILGLREKYRDQYWQERDPILKERLSWRAQTFRHMVHLVPGQTIL